MNKLKLEPKTLEVVEDIANNGCGYIGDPEPDCYYCPLKVFDNSNISCKDIAKTLLETCEK